MRHAVAILAALAVAAALAQGSAFSVAVLLPERHLVPIAVFDGAAWRPHEGAASSRWTVWHWPDPAAPLQVVAPVKLPCGDRPAFSTTWPTTSVEKYKDTALALDADVPVVPLERVEPRRAPARVRNALGGATLQALWRLSEPEGAVYYVGAVRDGVEVRGWIIDAGGELYEVSESIERVLQIDACR